MTLEELKVIISAETLGLKKGLNECQTELKQLNSSTNSATKSVSGLGSAFKKAFNVAAIVMVAKAIASIGSACVEAASDLAEVQNVVDVAFGSAASEVNAFAKTAITQLGMSETAAKEMASTFMAMGNGMGIVAADGKNMSLSLTTLAADMASFYNVSLDVAATALKSVYTGETESLKKFGVVMTEANLEQFAFSQGITKSYKEMSQAEKVMLRYNYVMSVTSNAQGDFARTSEGWANQTRILSMQFLQLKANIGQGLIQALTPVLKVINQLLSKLVLLSNAFAKIFGGSSISGSATAAAEDMEVATDGVASDMEDAADSAKKMANAASGVDELNVINQDSGSGSSTTAGGAAGFGVDAFEFDASEEADGLFDKIVQKAKDFVDKIKNIFSDAFSNMPKLELNIDWEKMLERVDSILTNIAQTTALVVSFVVRLVTLILNDLNISLLIEDITEVLDETSKLGTVIAEVVIPELERLYKDYLSPIVVWIGDKLHQATQIAKEGLQEFSKWVVDNKEKFQAWITVIGRVIAAIWKVLEPILNTAWEDFKVVIRVIWDILGGILTVLMDLGPIFLDLMNGDTTAAWEDFKVLIGDVGNLFVKLWEDIQNFAIVKWAKQVWEGIKEIWGNVANWFDENVIQPIVNFFAPIVEWISGFFEGCWLIILAVWIVVSTWFNENVIQPTIEVFRPIVETVGNFFSDLWSGIKKVWEKASEWFKNTIINPIKEAFNSVCDAIGGFFDKLWDKVKRGVVGAVNWIIDKLETGINRIIDAFNSFLDGFNELATWAGEIVGQDWSGVGQLSHVALNRIPTAETGGTFNQGQLFIANEAGPELVGRYGNQTGVMNNDQIVSAVSEGVYNAVKSAMGNGQNVQVFLDGRQIESSVRSTYQQRGAVIASGGLLDYSFA